MTKKNTFLILVLLIQFFLCANSFTQEFGDIIFINNSIYEQFLKKNDIPIYFDEYHFYYFVDQNIKEDDLLKFFLLLSLKNDIHIKNILNTNTTRTNEGGCFKRKRLFVNDDGNMLIEKDNKGKYVYDPKHPDKILEGEYKDYVEYPNINIIKELIDLLNNSRLWEQLIIECNIKKIKIPEEYNRPFISSEEIVKFIEMNKEKLIDGRGIEQEELLNSFGNS